MRGFLLSLAIAACLFSAPLTAPAADDTKIPSLAAEESKNITALLSGALPPDATGIQFKSAHLVASGRKDQDSVPQQIVNFDANSQELRITSPGLYLLNIEYKSNGADATDTFLVRAVPKQAGEIAKPVEPAKKALPQLGLSTAPNPTALRRHMNLDASNLEFKTLVIQTAGAWGTTHTGGRDYVARFDQRPAETCTTIAGILRDTAKELRAERPIEEARTTMEARFEQFYRSGDSEYFLVNPYEHDWEPFLQALQNAVTERAGDRINDPQYVQLVLIELAEGFAELANLFRGVDPRRGAVPPGFTGGFPGGAPGMYAPAPTTFLPPPGKKGRKTRCCMKLLFGK
jgi:hypothetical protein